MNKKNLQKTLLALLAILTFSACSKDSEESADTSTEFVSENNDERSKETNKETNTNDEGKEDTADGINIIDDGTYTSSLEPGRNGEREADGSWANVYDIAIDGDKLIVKGSLDFFSDDDTSSEAKPLENQVNVFKIDDATQFTTQSNSSSETNTHSQEEFLNMYNETKDQQLALFVQVANGTVMEVHMGLK
ncbi:hypothetical protein [Anaerococcus provencensis]|uniref:hypothetical protein n=1 Tax=Anaerococcus provencensis TaxID=938293 RepID=UPI0002FF39C1|nr:hypothetical protein [Anaerococcus provencensis]